MNCREFSEKYNIDINLVIRSANKNGYSRSHPLTESQLFNAVKMELFNNILFHRRQLNERTAEYDELVQRKGEIAQGKGE